MDDSHSWQGHRILQRFFTGLPPWGRALVLVAVGAIAVTALAGLALFFANGYRTLSPQPRWLVPFAASVAIAGALAMLCLPGGVLFPAWWTRRWTRAIARLGAVLIVAAFSYMGTFELYAQAAVLTVVRDERQVVAPRSFDHRRSGRSVTVFVEGRLVQLPLPHSQAAVQRMAQSNICMTIHVVHGAWDVVRVGIAGTVPADDAQCIQARSAQ